MSEQSDEASADGAAGSQDSSTIGTVARVVAVLRVLAESQESVAVQEVARQVGLAPSSAHRLLGLLIDANMVERDANARRYRVGREFSRMAALVSARCDLAQQAMPYLKRLASLCDEVSIIGVYHPGERVMSFAGRVDGTNPLTYRIELHRPLPVYWGSSGQAIFAYLPLEERRLIAQEAGSSLTDGRAPLPWDEMEARLEEIREQGYAISYGEKLPGAVGTSAPVFNAHGIVGSMTITVPRFRYNPEDHARILDPLLEAARELSHDLGHRPTR
ncbi:MAG: IclR family transcriptional regulator [Actinomycetota bacterium]|nr:IclR family transcriptional regulator [Actinomycetota bacterium]